VTTKGSCLPERTLACNTGMAAKVRASCIKSECNMASVQGIEKRENGYGEQEKGTKQKDLYYIPM
jgi:hypothetical protein